MGIACPSNPHNEIYNIAVCKILMLHWFVYAWLYFLRVIISRYFFHLLKNIDTKIFVTHKFAIYHLFTNYFACLYFTFLYSTFQTCNYCYSAFFKHTPMWPKETKDMFVVYMYLQSWRIFTIIKSETLIFSSYDKAFNDEHL